MHRSRDVFHRAALVALVAALTSCGGAPSVADLPTHHSSQSASATPAPSPTANATTRSTRQPTAAASAAFGSAPVGRTEIGTVVAVVDGDTIKVEISGTVYTVRYIGIDTPETVHPSQPVEWMGPEASAANSRLIGDRQVVLEKDVSEMDRYGRLLRYVWLDEGSAWLLVNRELVRLGFANASSYPPDVAYQDLFRQAEADAREAGLGLWAATPSAAPSQPPGPSAQAGDCDPSYPDVCIAPSPPDLDCADIPFRRFAVIPPDPHRFDGDHNGIGCESG